MNITAARWVFRQHQPTLLVEFSDGRRARMSETMLKPTLVAQGVVMLAPDDGGHWDEELPPVTVTSDGVSDTLQGGFVRHPQLAALAHDFSEAAWRGTFAPKELTV